MPPSGPADQWLNLAHARDLWLNLADTPDPADRGGEATRREPSEAVGSDPGEAARPRRRADLAGATRAKLRSQICPHHGFYREGTLDDAVLQRIVDTAAVLPAGGVVGGWAAANLLGATVLDGRDQPVLVIVPPERTITRKGITTLRTRLDPADIVAHQGISCTSGVRTAFDILRLAPSLTEAVVAGDCLLRAGLVSPSSLLSYAATQPHRRGLRQLRLAVPQLDSASASPPESRLRMLCHLRTALPPLLVNAMVLSPSGTFLGIPDLLEPTTGLAIEYDGEYHRELRQHTADNLREERLESAGLTVLRVTALDLKDQTATATRITNTYNRRLTRGPITPSWTLSPRPSAA